MKRGVAYLLPFMEAEKAGGAQPQGKIVMATVKGDVHDIGKNIQTSSSAGGWRSASPEGGHLMRSLEEAGFQQEPGLRHFSELSLSQGLQTITVGAVGGKPPMIAR